MMLSSVILIAMKSDFGLICPGLSVYLWVLHRLDIGTQLLGTERNATIRKEEYTHCLRLKSGYNYTGYSVRLIFDFDFC